MIFCNGSGNGPTISIPATGRSSLICCTPSSASPRATKIKPPNCLLTEFAEAGMKFSLTFWIADPDGMDNVKSEVMLALWDAFKREGIRVPYPVREIRVRGGALPVETAVEVSS